VLAKVPGVGVGNGTGCGFTGSYDEVAKRMNTDMIFDTSDAVRDLDFSPIPFELVIKSASSTRDTLLKKQR